MYKKTKDFFQIASHIPVFFTLVVFSVQMDDVFDGTNNMTFTCWYYLDSLGAYRTGVLRCCPSSQMKSP